MIDHKSKTLSDKISVIGELEHAIYHARKSAGVVEDENKKTFYLTMAQMFLDFRRAYMKRHFPNCPDELWCLVKATETARQRVYEADEGDVEDIEGIDAIWANVMEELTGEDLSGCSSCKEDKGKGILEGLSDDKDRYYDAIALRGDAYRVKGGIYHLAVRRDDGVYDEGIRVLFDGKIGGRVDEVYETKELFEKDWAILNELGLETPSAEVPSGAVHHYMAEALEDYGNILKGEVHSIYTQVLQNGSVGVSFDGTYYFYYDSKEDFEKAWKIIKED